MNFTFKWRSRYRLLLFSFSFLWLFIIEYMFRVARRNFRRLTKVFEITRRVVAKRKSGFRSAAFRKAPNKRYREISVTCVGDGTRFQILPKIYSSTSFSLGDRITSVLLEKYLNLFDISSQRHTP